MHCVNFTIIFEGLIALFTGLLWIYNLKLWKTTEKSIELTKQEFIASHPPKLRIHSISLHKFLETDKPWEIKCFITNIGGSSATIKKSNMTFKRLEDQLPARLPFSDKYHMLTEKPIAPGESIIEPLILALDDQTSNSLNIKMWNGPRGGNKKEMIPFYFFGYIDYLDGVRTNRRIAFCRQFNIETERFTAVEDEDHEYSY